MNKEKNYAIDEDVFKAGDWKTMTINYFAPENNRLKSLPITRKSSTFAQSYNQP